MWENAQGSVSPTFCQLRGLSGWKPRESCLASFLPFVKGVGEWVGSREVWNPEGCHLAGVGEEY